MPTGSPRTAFAVLVPPVPHAHRPAAACAPALRRHRTEAPAVRSSTSYCRAPAQRASSEPPTPSTDLDDGLKPREMSALKAGPVAFVPETGRTLSEHPLGDGSASLASRSPAIPLQEGPSRALGKRPRLDHSDPQEEGDPPADDEFPQKQGSPVIDDEDFADADEDVPTPPGKKLRMGPPRRPVPPPLAPRPGLKASPASRKPFKRPAVSSPAGHHSHEGVGGRGEESEGAKRTRLVKRIKELEEQMRVSEEAKRIRDGKLTEELVEETKMWRDAGRKAAAMLFERYGDPSAFSSTGNAWAYQDSFSDQHWPVDRPGAVEDEEDEGELPDLDAELERVGKLKRHGKRKGGGASSSSDAGGHVEGDKPWNIGTMMERMGYRPEILGWDPEEEDWTDD